MASHFVELTFKVPFYRRHCARWYEDKSPDTIADALALSCTAYASFQRRCSAQINLYDHNDELRQLHSHNQKIISEMSGGNSLPPKTVIERPVIESCVQPLVIESVNPIEATKSDIEPTHQPTQEQIETIIDAIESYYDSKKRYPKTMNPLKSYMTESQWDSLKIYKGEYKDILQLVCPNN